MKTPKGWTAKEYAEHMLWISSFANAKEVKSVPSNTKGKVQRKTNKSRNGSKPDVRTEVQWFDTKRTCNLVETILVKTDILTDNIS